MTSPGMPVFRFAADVPVRPGHPQMQATTHPPYQQPTSPGSYGVYFPVSSQGVNISDFIPQQHSLRQYTPYPQQQNGTSSQTPPPQPLQYIPTSHGHHYRATTPPLNVSPKGPYPSYRVSVTPPSSNFQNFQAAAKYSQNVFTPSIQHQQQSHQVLSNLHQNIAYSQSGNGDGHFTNSQSGYAHSTGMMPSVDFSYGQQSPGVKNSTFEKSLNTRNQSFLGVYSDDQTLLMKGPYNQGIPVSSAEDIFKVKASKYGIDITTKKEHGPNVTEKLAQNAKATEVKKNCSLNTNIFKEKMTRYGIEIVNPNSIFDQIETVTETFNVVEDETLKEDTNYKTELESSNNSSATLCEALLKDEVGSPDVDSFDVSKEKNSTGETTDLFKYMASQHGITIKSPSPKRSGSTLLLNEDEDSFKSAAEELNSNETSDDDTGGILSEDSGILGNQVLFALSNKSGKCSQTTKKTKTSENIEDNVRTAISLENKSEEDIKKLAAIIVSDCISNACTELKKEGYNVEKRKKRLYSWEYKSVEKQDSSRETEEQSEKVKGDLENDLNKASEGSRITTAESDINMNDNRTLKQNEEKIGEMNTFKEKKDLKPSGGLNPAVPEFIPKFEDDHCKFENGDNKTISDDTIENGNVNTDYELDVDAVSSDKSKFKKLLNPSTPEFKPKGNKGNVVTDSEKFTVDQCVKSGQVLNANISEFIPGESGGNFMVHGSGAYVTVLDPHLPEYQLNSATMNSRVDQSVLMPASGPVFQIYQPTKMHSATQTEIVQTVDQSSNTKKVKQNNQQVETVSCDLREVCVNTVETFDDEEGEFYLPPPIKSDSGMMTEPVSSCDKGMVFKVEQKSKSSLTDENNNVYRLLRKTQRELLQLRYQVCLAEIQRQIEEIEKNKGKWLQIFSSVNEKRSLDEMVESKIASLKIETNILQSKLLMYENQLEEGHVWQQVPTLGLSIPIGQCDIKVVNRQAVVKRATSEKSISSIKSPITQNSDRTNSMPFIENGTSLHVPVSECKSRFPFSDRLTSLQNFDSRTITASSENRTIIPVSESKIRIPVSESRTSIPVSESGTSIPVSEKTGIQISDSRTSLSSVENRTSLFQSMETSPIYKRKTAGSSTARLDPDIQKPTCISPFESKSNLEITNRHGSVGEKPAAYRRGLSTDDDNEVASFMITDSDKMNLKTLDKDSSSEFMVSSEKMTASNSKSCDIPKDVADLPSDEKSSTDENVYLEQSSNIPVLNFAIELVSDMDKKVKSSFRQENGPQVTLSSSSSSSSSGSLSSPLFDSVNSSVCNTSDLKCINTTATSVVMTTVSSSVSSADSVNMTSTSSVSALSTSRTSSSSPSLSTSSTSQPVSVPSVINLTGQKLDYEMPKTSHVIGGSQICPGDATIPEQVVVKNPTIPVQPPIKTRVVPTQIPVAGVPLNSQLPAGRPLLPAHRHGLASQLIPPGAVIGAQTPNIQQMPNLGNSNQPTVRENPENVASAMVNLGNMVDRKLFEAVVTQLKQAYPDMAKNPEMLRAVALQQTAVLQCYVAKGHNPLKSKSGMDCKESKSDDNIYQPVYKTATSFAGSSVADVLNQEQDLNIDEEKPVRLPPGFGKRPDSLPELENKSPSKMKKEPFKPRNFLDDFTPSKMTSESIVKTAVGMPNRTFDESKSRGVSLPQNYDVGLESGKRKRSVLDSMSSSRPTTPQFIDKSNTNNLPQSFQKKVDESGNLRHTSLSSETFVKENWDDDIDPYDNTNFVLDSRPKNKIDNPAANSVHKPLLPTPVTGFDNFTDSSMHKPLLPTSVNMLDDFPDTSQRKPLLPTPAGLSQVSSENELYGSQKLSKSAGFSGKSLNPNRFETVKIINSCEIVSSWLENQEEKEGSGWYSSRNVTEELPKFSYAQLAAKVTPTYQDLDTGGKAATPPLGECIGDITEITLPKLKNAITGDKKSEVGTDEESWQQVTKKKRKQEPPGTQTTKASVQSKKKQNPGTKADAAQKASNFESLVSRISDTFNGLNRAECIQIITDVRNARGGLSGLTLKQILDDAKTIVKTRSTNTTVQKPGNTSLSPSRVHSTTPPLTSSGFTPPFLRKSYDMAKVGMDIDDDEDICVICHDGLSAFETKSLDCNHVFHSKCIKEWVLKRERTCPTCRRHALFAEEFPKLGK